MSSLYKCLILKCLLLKYFQYFKGLIFQIHNSAFPKINNYQTGTLHIVLSNIDFVEDDMFISRSMGHDSLQGMMRAYL
jgi:hypothetical protein